MQYCGFDSQVCRVSEHVGHLKRATSKGRFVIKIGQDKKAWRRSVVWVTYFQKVIKILDFDGLIILSNILNS